MTFWLIILLDCCAWHYAARDLHKRYKAHAASK